MIVYQRAMELRKIIEVEKKIINNTVLNEVLNSLDKNLNYEKVKKIVNSIYNIDEIYYLSKDDYNESLGLFHNYNHSINFSDCKILEVMVKKKKQIALFHLILILER